MLAGNQSHLFLCSALCLQVLLVQQLLLVGNLCLVPLMLLDRSLLAVKLPVFALQRRSVPHNLTTFSALQAWKNPLKFCSESGSRQILYFAEDGSAGRPLHDACTIFKPGVMPHETQDSQSSGRGLT